MSNETSDRAAALATCDSAGEGYVEYNEGAFRYLLGASQVRADRARRSLLLLLVELKIDSGGSSRIAPGDAEHVFSGLAACLREIDVIGWYRGGLSVGAILMSSGPSEPSPAVCGDIGARVAKALASSLAPQMANRVRVRVLQLRRGSRA